MKRRLGAALAALAMAAAGAARASGPGTIAPWYLDAFGGEPADRAARNAGRLGVVMARTQRSELYIAWRLLSARFGG